MLFVGVTGVPFYVYFTIIGFIVNQGKSANHAPSLFYIAGFCLQILRTIACSFRSFAFVSPLNMLPF